MAKTIRIPTRRRKYTQVAGFVSGLIYDLPSTMISDEAMSECCNVVVYDGMVMKMKGTEYFAQTDVAEPLICVVEVVKLLASNLNCEVSVTV